MGLVHTPRVIASIAKGLVLRQRASTKEIRGLTAKDPHSTSAHAGLFDIDYIGHMNNAAYLNHAEYARWQWTAETGLLNTFMREQTAFIVTASFIRYRREIKPIFRKFEIQTCISGLDARTMSVYQTFRYPGEGGKNKIRAQILLKAVIRKGPDFVDPRDFLVLSAGVDPEVVASLCSNGGLAMEDELKQFELLENSLKETAAADDRRIDGPK